MNSEKDIEEKTGNILIDTILELPSMISKNKMFVAILAFLFLIPLGTSTSTGPVRYLLFLLTQIMIFGLLAMSFDLQLGRAGLLNFGHVALFGVGAYVMAYTVDFYPLSIGLGILAGAGVGFIMGLTTSRLKGTAFAFIALAMAMFLFNFFVENPAISGGETGLRIATPALIKTAAFFLMFVIITFVVFAAFILMVILYLKKRREPIGLVFFVLVIEYIVGILLAFGTNILGPAIIFIAFLGMLVLYLKERRTSSIDPFQFSESRLSPTEEVKPINMILTNIVPISIIIIALLGLAVTFGSNIMILFETSDTYFLTIPVQYYFVLTCVSVVYILVRQLVSSPFGRMVVAVAQNEERAEALGYNSYYSKIVVVAISGAIAGLAGALYAPLIRTIDPHSALGVDVTINAMLYTIIGGIGTLLGPLFGAGIVVYSELNLVDYIGDAWLVGLGIIYIFIVLFMPRGFVGSIKSRAYAIKERISRLKIGKFEFGVKEDDYWVFALAGAIIVFILMLLVSL